MKAWVLADAANGHHGFGSFILEKKDGQMEKGLAHKVVLELTDDERLHNKGYVVVTDNFYSSPALFHDLVKRGFGAIGTVCKDRRGIPPALRTACLQRGGVTSSSDDSIFSLKWKDKREVVMLSTYHDYDSTMVTKSRRARRVEGGIEEIKKRQVVEDYNQNMGGVDKSEFLLYHECTCKHTCNFLL